MIDALTHLDFPEADGVRAAMVQRARAAGVDRWVIAATHPATWDRTLRVAEETGGIAALGTHPWWAGEHDSAALRARDPRVIGEIGLDRAKGDWRQQVTVFRDQLALARERDRPVILHLVRAWPQARAILRADGCPRGMVHGWSAPADAVAEAEALGLHVSFGTTLLRGRHGKVRESCRRVTLDRLLVETDSPEHGEPADLLRVLAGVAECQGLGVDRIARAATRNAERLLGAS